MHYVEEAAKASTRRAQARRVKGRVAARDSKPQQEAGEKCGLGRPSRRSTRNGAPGNSPERLREIAIVYEESLREIRGITAGETDWLANLANIAAVLFERLSFSWVGFYRAVGDELVLGPFQGPPACVRIGRGHGVCGAAWEKDETIVVPDVHAFDGHIPCDPHSRSEVVLPIHVDDGKVWGVLDVDSRKPDDFHDSDVKALKEVVLVVEEILGRVTPGTRH